jgi:hypothetical protein
VRRFYVRDPARHRLFGGLAIAWCGITLAALSSWSVAYVLAFSSIIRLATAKKKPRGLGRARVTSQSVSAVFRSAHTR